MRITSAVTVTFTALNNNTLSPIPNVIVTFEGLTVSYSETKVTDSFGKAIFSGVENMALYAYNLVHQDYNSEANTLFVNSDKSITVELEPKPANQWDDMYFSDGNIEIITHPTDADKIYYGGERMNQISTLTNVRMSGYIRLDSQTSIRSQVYQEDGTPTDWKSTHTPDPPQYLLLKPGGWIKTTTNNAEFRECVGKAIINMEGINVELSGDEYVCIVETRHENMVPYYLDGNYYSNFTVTYKLDNNPSIQTFGYESPVYTIINENTGINHPPLLNDITGTIGFEGEELRLAPIADDPDNDELIVTVNDSRFEFSVFDGNSYIYIWQTSESDVGRYSVEFTISDGEYSVSKKANVTVLKEYKIELFEGLNLISLPVIPVTGNLYNEPVFHDLTEEVFAPIIDSLETIFAFYQGEWLNYNPEKPAFLNTLNNVYETMGFWVKMNEPKTLTYGGLPKKTVEFNLQQGLNLIGYPALNNHAITVALENVAGTYTNIMTYDASTNEWWTYNPNKPAFLNSLDEMMPKYGYWLRTTGDATWNLEGGMFSQ
ncbi:MAG: hypothetical protein KKH40_08285 [Nanoarchaeota archaeon]|nr:hypothetical protein [Nanoarchaeota archaeon]